jgi:hypothetical protein
MLMPNRYSHPLRAEEAIAEYHSDRPDRLIELAQETGNRGLRAVAVGIGFEQRRMKKAKNGRRS